MRWWVLVLLPFHLLAQQTYNDCVAIPPQSYQVDYDADKNYYWSISSGEIISTFDNTVTIQWPDTAGEYFISVHTTRFGCEGDTSYYQLVIDPCPYATLFFPTSFSPNGDGINDEYIIGGRSVDNIEYFAVYNRWGERIFESLSNIAWDGKDVPIGVYTINVFVKNKRYVRPVTLVR